MMNGMITGLKAKPIGVCEVIRENESKKLLDR